MVRDIVSMIPYATEWLGCPNTQIITIKIFDKFDNDDFGLIIRSSGRRNHFDTL